MNWDFFSQVFSNAISFFTGCFRGIWSFLSSSPVTLFAIAILLFLPLLGLVIAFFQSWGQSNMSPGFGDYRGEGAISMFRYYRRWKRQRNKSTSSNTPNKKKNGTVTVDGVRYSTTSGYRRSGNYVSLKLSKKQIQGYVKEAERVRAEINQQSQPKPERELDIENDDQ